MGTNNRVIWSEGLFLRPHHFQQAERFLERWVDAKVSAVQPFAYGFTHLELDQEALKQGKIGLKTAIGVMPDGTPFALPEDMPAPLPLDVAADRRDTVVCLALPMRRSGMPEFTLDSAGHDGLARYTSVDTRVADAIAETQDSADMKVGQLNLRLAMTGDALDAYSTLGVAKLIERRSTRQVVLDLRYIPPCLDCRASAILVEFLREVGNLVKHRANTVADRLGQPGQKGVAEIADFLMLQLLNRFDPLLDHYSRTALLHPESFFGLLLTLAAELATYTHTDRRPIEPPPYRHDALDETFAPLVADLRESLTAVIEQNAVAIPIEDRGRGLFTAMIPDPDLLHNASFVLVIQAGMPTEQIRQIFPTQVKIGPSDKIRDLVMSQLPGIMLTLLPVAPRQIPYHAGYCYFELDRGSEFWKHMETNRLLAMHIAGDFPGMQIEFWAIRN